MHASNTPDKTSSPLMAWLKRNTLLISIMVVMAALPFAIALFEGQSFTAAIANEAGQAKFIQGLMIEIGILAIYAISYDLVFGVTGLLSFGHAMFFAVGAYLSGAMLKSFGWSFWPTVGLVMLAAVVNALLFAIVLPRVKGITFALVTLGMAAVFEIVVKSREMLDYTGADVGLQGVIPPDFLNPSTQRMRLYYLVLILVLLVYLLYRRFVDSPTGRVCIASAQNEDRALMLGFNTFWFKLIALILAAMTAGLAGVLHMIYQPIVSPNVASLGYTIVALLIILIGGVGTLSGAIVGAAVYRLMAFYLEKFFGEYASFLIGAVYVALVLFLPYGIVGTWRLRAIESRQGRQRLLRLLTGKGGG